MSQDESLLKNSFLAAAPQNLGLPSLGLLEGKWGE